MRVRVRYSKTGKLRYISAIDLGRVWERALRRADLPIAYSEGFSPHPKISFPDALPLGYASTGEYAELAFAGPIALDPAIAALNAALPEGMRVLAATTVAEGAPRLSKWLQASLWELAYPAAAPAAVLAEAVARAAAADALTVSRERKGETTEVDLRPALYEISSSDRVVHVVTHHVDPPARPTEIHAALAGAVRDLGDELPSPELATRVAQGSPADGGLVEALGGERLSGPAPATIEH